MENVHVLVSMMLQGPKRTKDSTISWIPGMHETESLEWALTLEGHISASLMHG